VTRQAPAVTYLGFANARLPDTDYRIAYSKRSAVSEVYLALPGKPAALPEDRFIQLNVGEGLSLATLRGLIGVPRALKATRADVAHFYATQLALLGPPLARLVRAKSIITVTGLGRSFSGTGLRGRALRAAYLSTFRISAALSSAVLFQNPEDLKVLSRYASVKARAKFTLIGSAIDETYFDGRRQTDEALLPKCVMIGRVHPSKGVEDFIQIARRLEGRARFVLVGPASAGAIESLASVRSAVDAGYLDYLGELADWQVRELLATCDVLVMPSRGEGIPRVVLEASLSGVATVGYDIAGCKETMPEDSLVPSFDLAALQDRVARVLDSDDERKGLVAGGQEIVVKRFSVEQYVARLDSVVQDAMGARRNG
jgi:glycosyltransferase involved in cell wall biosynthesis